MELVLPACAIVILKLLTGKFGTDTAVVSDLLLIQLFGIKLDLVAATNHSSLFSVPRIIQLKELTFIIDIYV